jgi:hypothetical protein
MVGKLQKRYQSAKVIGVKGETKATIKTRKDQARRILIEITSKKFLNSNKYYQLVPITC